MDKPVKMRDNVYILPRGGFLVDTPIGDIQFGSPPETIKDTMLLDNGVPSIFVLTRDMFSWVKGISIAEIEFPLYYNFFIKNKKTYVICRQEQFNQMKKVLQQSLFGPEEFDITDDYENGHPEEQIPDIKSEMDYFRRNLKLSDLVAFGIIKDRKFTFKGVTITINSKDDFTVTYKSKQIAEVPGSFEYKPYYMIGERLPEPYRPPLFSVTCLGPSHGFDPGENTSGFIIWLNHQGIMVDPPVNSTEWLEDSNVSPKLIDSIILTHCHADHDAGTFQKILEEGKVTIYTTETVMRSFLEKYSALSQIDSSYLMKLFTFHPVKIGRPVFINGGKFDMFYTLHSIPTIGFKMEFQNQSFVYSSDHNNDPDLHRQLLDTEVITSERYGELQNFPWDSKVIYHESGIPPLHTPIKFLNSLPKKVQKRTVVYHIAQKDFPEKTNLTLATFGIENSLNFKTSSPRFEEAYRILGVFKHLDFFHEIPIERAQELLDIVEIEHYKKGDVIIEKGTTGDRFYIIYSGSVKVETGSGLEQNKIYGSYDYFGEVALVTDRTRAADVIAETDVVCYTIERYKFLNFIVGTEFERSLKRLANIRSSETWNLLSTNHFFQQCTSSQKTWLESIFIPMEKNKAGVLLKEGHPIDYIYIIRDGIVHVIRGNKRLAVLGRGDFVGTMQSVHKGEGSRYTFTHEDGVSLYAMKAEDILKFVENNPGLLMKLVYDFG